MRIRHIGTIETSHNGQRTMTKINRTICKLGASRTEPSRFDAAIPMISIDFICADKKRRTCVQFIERGTGKAIAFVDIVDGTATRVGMLPAMDQPSVICRAISFLASVESIPYGATQ
jgi:hypothetical protein